MSRFFVVLTLVALLPLVAWADARSARSFAHSVAHEAARVEPPTGDKSYVSIRCWQASATPVYLGGKDVTPKNGYAICTNTPCSGADNRMAGGSACQADFIDLDVSNLYAVVSRPPGTPRLPGHAIPVVHHRSVSRGPS